MTDKQVLAQQYAQQFAQQYAAELAAMARDVIATNRYFVLGTAHPDGHPRVSPVYFNHHEHRSFYWVSSPDSQHSHNIAGDPRVNAVVFDSSTPPGQNRAVYLTGTATEVPEVDLEGEIPRAFTQVDKGGRPFSVQELSGDGDLRLYRLDTATAEVHARGGHPDWGLGIDTRLPVSLG
jgi:nitroimidazol reductase NimA-like FMN-containing flavoprotein (pyridoxamine 5'-phosphate oxidase superfamily)